MDLGQCTLVELFESGVVRFSDRVAVTAEDGVLTYLELKRRSDLLAAELRAAGAGPGTLVALLVPRGARLLIGVLGILKAGAAYVPLDPGYPPERIAWTVEDSGAAVIVSAPEQAGTIADSGAGLVLLDRLAPEPAGGAEPLTEGTTTAGSPAYVIYTSGSTGVPKGVPVEHHQVLRLFEVTRERFGFDENDVWTLCHSAAFDFSVWEMWGALLFGGRLVVVPLETVRSPDALHELLRRERVTVLNQTPSAFGRLAAADARSPERLTSLRVVVFGGERLEPAMLRDWFERHGDENPRLVNMYGLTEATVHASYRPLTVDDVDVHGASPIGHPLPGLVFHVLGDDGRPVAEGEPGELYIEGAGLARGYLGRPDLNKERFVDHTAPDGTVRRCYRTGDRIVALPGGGYGYLGRTDDQMKIRGYRVEPGEIEAVLLRHEAVSAAAVLPHDYGGSDVRVVAYVESGARAETLAPELGEAAGAALPPHMRPSAYVVLPELPLTRNGKVDKERLPAPVAGAASAPVHLVDGDGPELTATERRVAGIWQSVLDVSEVPADADFFDLGGTSLSLLRMFEQVNEAFGIELEITVLIDGATVRALARHVDGALPTSPALTG
ncbi:amino acid adenylation domain-containing protein [Streptomyces sp. MNU89]|uniref:amino acid adenylation domain-containing protein n=1 Tax=Streptomyces sp. MNU89 TaxID=2560025 RepID=UPI001E46740F|nr:amino acid adenylation domain-containing protein [Streptomyces sp. MNU89]MCC9738247.1 amino acid adenylation domain-containing protein [Streptomyces sp. MNU89]